MLAVVVIMKKCLELLSCDVHYHKNKIPSWALQIEYKLRVALATDM